MTLIALTTSIILLSLGVQSLAGIGVTLPENPLPTVCFIPTEETRELAQNQDMTCIWAHPGQYPPARARYHAFLGGCCFLEMPESGVFWLIGESVMTEILPVWIDAGALHSTTEFELKTAQLLDVLVVDEESQEPIEDARVTVANDAVHLVSFTRMTDEDGYAVIPVLALKDYVMSVRADGYLAPNPMYFTAMPEEMPKAVVELDSGIEIRGRVLDFEGNPVEGAQIHVVIDRVSGGRWDSDIDLPRPISAVATQGESWAPSRGSYSTDARGLFRVQTLPRGKTRLYASHERFAPSLWENIDTSENVPTDAVPLVLKPFRRAWLRVENAHGAAVSATVTVTDRSTGQDVAQITTQASGASDVKKMPEFARFLVTSDGYYPKQIEKDIHEGDELTIVLDRMIDGRIGLEIRDGNQAVENVTLSPAGSDVRKQHPLCLGKTLSDGTATLESCPEAFWLEISHPRYARMMIYIHPGAERDKRTVSLTAGEAVQMAFEDAQTHEPVADVACELTTVYTSGAERYAYKEEISASDGILKLEHRPQFEHSLACTAPHRPSVKQSFVPPDAPKIVELPHVISRTAVITDSLGGAVSYAGIVINGEFVESDYEGEVHLTGLPQSPVEVYHWQHGHARATLTESASTLEIRLPDQPDREVLRCMNEIHHIQTGIDGAAILIDQIELPRGLKRGDGVERCSAKAIVVIRDGRRINVEL